MVKKAEVINTFNWKVIVTRPVERRVSMCGSEYYDCNSRDNSPCPALFSSYKPILMPTVFNLIKIYCTHNQLPLPNETLRRYIGRTTVKKWYTLKVKCTLNYQKIIEGDNIYNVLSYPSFFAGEIIDIIHKYLNTKGGLIKPTPNLYIRNNKPLHHLLNYLPTSSQLTYPLHKGYQRDTPTPKNSAKGSGTLKDNLDYNNNNNQNTHKGYQRDTPTPKNSAKGSETLKDNLDYNNNNNQPLHKPSEPLPNNTSCNNLPLNN